MNDMHTTLSTSEFTYNPNTGCFTAEISEMKLTVNIRTLNSITLRNPRTRRTMLFTFDKADVDGSGEDIYGWRFKSTTGHSILIIND